MSLLFFDLDNTLSDRTASMARWAPKYVVERYGEPDEALAQEIIRIDAEGLRPKPETAADLAQLLGLTPQEEASIIAVLRAGTLAELRPNPEVIPQLQRVRDAGWTPFIVTNGKQSQQEAKVEKIGIGPYVAGMVVSEGAGVAKPDPTIFQIAAQTAGMPLEDAWMVGDSAHADIAGANAAGIKSVWLAHGRDYPDGLPAPTHIAGSLTEAVDIILGAQT